VFNHKVFACTAKPTLNFIDYQKDAVLVADLPKSAQELGRGNNVATFTKEGLDNDGSGVAGSTLLGQEEVELMERVRHES